MPANSNDYHYKNGSDSSGSTPRLPSLPQRLAIVEKIMSESITDVAVKKHRPRAQFTFFCGNDPETLGGHDGQLEVVGRCLEWFVFDYEIAEIGQTPAQRWLNLNAGKLTEQQLHDATDCLGFVLGIFEIAQVESDEGFIAVDLLRKEKLYSVSEHVINNELLSGQMLLGRLFPHHDHYTLSGMATIMDQRATAQMKELIYSRRLKAELILEDIDGVELENLFGRSLMDIEKIKDINIIKNRLRHYVQDIVPGRISFDQFLKAVDDAPDPIEVAVMLCREIGINCRHEIELLIAYIMSFWFKTHMK